MQLTPNFTLSELTHSDTATRKGIDNTPAPAHKNALSILALGLEQVRSICGNSPITVTSGYRGIALNAAVRGVTSSAHCKGYAADVTVKGMTPRAVALRLAASHLVFDQVILETSRGVVHVSFDPRLRGEVKTQAGGPGSPVVWGIE